MKLDNKKIELLIQKAKDGSEKCFLTKSTGTKYGASVLTEKDNIYFSGQYSSFNHITNIHAEMSAILMATMNNDPNVIALALVSDNAIDVTAKMCGICREFLNEHSQRTRKEIIIIFSSFDGEIIEKYKLDDLLPKKWIANKG